MGYPITGFGEKDRSMSSESKIDASPEMTSHNAAGVAGLDFQYLSHYFATFPDPVMMVNSIGRVVFLNRAAEDLIGFSFQTAESAPLCRAILKSDMENEGVLPEEFFCGEESLIRLPVKLRNGQGEWCRMSMTTNPIRDEGGSPFQRGPCQVPKL